MMRKMCRMIRGSALTLNCKGNGLSIQKPSSQIDTIPWVCGHQVYNLLYLLIYLSPLHSPQSLKLPARYLTNTVASLQQEIWKGSTPDTIEEYPSVRASASLGRCFHLGRIRTVVELTKVIDLKANWRGQRPLVIKSVVSSVIGLVLLGTYNQW